MSGTVLGWLVTGRRWGHCQGKHPGSRGKSAASTEHWAWTSDCTLLMCPRQHSTRERPIHGSSFSLLLPWGQEPPTKAKASPQPFSRLPQPAGLPCEHESWRYRLSQITILHQHNGACSYLTYTPKRRGAVYYFLGKNQVSNSSISPSLNA